MRTKAGEIQGERRPFRIAIVTEFSVPYFVGGGEHRYYELAKELVARGHEVTWISMRQRHGQRRSPKRETIDGIRCIHLGPLIAAPPHRPLLAFPRYLVALFAYLVTHRYDIVDAQPFSPLLGAYLATRFTSAKFFATIYDVMSKDDDQFFERSVLGRFVERVLYRFPYRRIITISDSVRESLIKDYGIKGRKLKVVTCGVNLQTIDAVPAQRKRRDLLFIGRLVPHKHVDDFIAVAKELDATAAIIGAGSLEAEVREAIKEHRKITFLGRVDSYEALITEIKRSRILVLPSTREGFGIVLVEAGACRLPVVAYSCNGVVDVVADGVSGYVVQKRDVAALGSRVRMLLERPELAERMGAAGRKRAELLFTWKRAADQLEQVYREA